MSSDPTRRKKPSGSARERTERTKQKPGVVDGPQKPSRDAPSPLDAMIGVSDAKKLLKWTPRFIQQLVAEGYIKKTAHGTYRLIDLVHGAIDYLKDEDRRASKSAAAGRLRDVRTAEIEQRMAARSGTLKEQARDDAFAVLERFSGPLQSELLALPARVTKDLPLRRKIENGIRDAFAGASKRARAASDS